MTTAILEGTEQEYFSIGKVSQLTQVPSYVLRYWESEFRLLRPSRRDSGHRKYSRKDVENILKIKDLLYNRKFTILGAKKFLLQEDRKLPEQMKIEIGENGAAVELLQETQATLDEILEILK